MEHNEQEYVEPSEEGLVHQFKQLVAWAVVALEANDADALRQTLEVMVAAFDDSAQWLTTHLMQEYATGDADAVRETLRRIGVAYGVLVDMRVNPDALDSAGQ